MTSLERQIIQQRAVDEEVLRAEAARMAQVSLSGLAGQASMIGAAARVSVVEEHSHLPEDAEPIRPPEHIKRDRHILDFKTMEIKNSNPYAVYQDVHGEEFLYVCVRSFLNEKDYGERSSGEVKWIPHTGRDLSATEVNTFSHPLSHPLSHPPSHPLSQQMRNIYGTTTNPGLTIGTNYPIQNDAKIEEPEPTTLFGKFKAWCKEEIKLK